MFFISSFVETADEDRAPRIGPDVSVRFIVRLHGTDDTVVVGDGISAINAARQQGIVNLEDRMPRFLGGHYFTPES